MELNNKIVELRKTHQYTQQDLADLLGVSKSTYIKYERGERKPKYETLFKLSNIFGVSIDYLLGKEESKTKSNETEQNVSNLLNLISDTDFIEDIEKKYPGFIVTLEQLSELTNLVSDTDSYHIIDIIYLITTIGYDLINVYSLYKYLFTAHAVDKHTKGGIPKFTEAIYKSGKIVEEFNFLLNKYISRLQDADYYNDRIAYFKEYIEHNYDVENPILL